MKRISARQLARAAGVSPSTVSRVANESPLVHPETRRHVIKWARKLNCNLFGRSVGKSVCVLLHHLKNPLRGYPAELLMALGCELPARGYRMEIVWENDLPILNDSTICGGIDMTGEEENVRFWERHFTLPLVRVNGLSNRLNGVGAVMLNGFAGSVEAVRHLRGLGHSSIGFVSLEGHNEVRKLSRRWEGFVAAMREAGVEQPERLGCFLPGDATPQEIVRALRKSDCSAFICVGDIFGLRVSSALQEAGFRIPEDVSIVEWELPGVSEFMNPPRTTVGIDYPALAGNVLDMLEHHLRTGKMPPDVQSPHRLTARKSVTPFSAHESAHQRELGPIQRRILSSLGEEELGAREVAARLKTRPDNGTFRKALAGLRRLGLVEFTFPDSPRSVNQKIRRTRG